MTIIHSFKAALTECLYTGLLIQIISPCQADWIGEIQRKDLFGADEVIVTSSSNLCLRADRIDGLEVGYKDSRTYERLRRYLLDEFYAASGSLHESGLSALF